MKRKIISCILIGTFAVSMFSACGSGNTTPNDEIAAEADAKDADTIDEADSDEVSEEEGLDITDIRSLDDLENAIDDAGDAASPETDQLKADEEALISIALTEEELASLTPEQAAQLKTLCEIWYSEDDSIYNIESFEYTTDDDGKIVSCQSSTEGHMFLKPTYKTDYEYDEAGNLATKSVYDQDDDNALTKSSQYSYDGDGKLTQRVDTYGESPYSDLKSLEYSYTYDENGQLAEQQIDKYIVEEDDAKEKITVTYSNGLITNILEIYHGSNGDVPFTYHFEYEYDEDGRAKICSITEDDSPDVVGTVTYEYDENNICTSTWDTSVLTELLEMVYDRSLFRFEKIVMDPNGNILSVIKSADGDDSEVEEMEYVRIYFLGE